MLTWKSWKKTPGLVITVSRPVVLRALVLKSMQPSQRTPDWPKNYTSGIWQIILEWLDEKTLKITTNFKGIPLRVCLFSY
jgi:hypothetical protein